MAADTGLPDIPFEQMTPEQRRDIAIRRIKAKDEFKVHLVIYLIINTMFVVFWAFTSNVLTAGPGSASFFWPIWPIVGWGVGVAIHGYTVYRGGVYSEERIQRELRSLR